MSYHDKARMIADILKRKHGIFPYYHADILMAKVGEDTVVWRRGQLICAQTPLMKKLFKAAFGRECIVVEQDTVEHVPKWSLLPFRALLWRLGLITSEEAFNNELIYAIACLWLARDPKVEDEQGRPKPGVYVMPREKVMELIRGYEV